VTRLIAFLLMLTISPAFATGVDEEVLADPAQEAEARAIMEDIRCLVCQNQSIENSNADMAQDLRRVVRERVLAGDNGGEVHTYMVARYGDWILMRPPVNERTWYLWLMPVFLVLVGLFAARSMMRRHRGAAPTQVDALSADEQAALDAILEQEKP